jgi:hypothetical protein
MSGVAAARPAGLTSQPVRQMLRIPVSPALRCERHMPGPSNLLCARGLLVLVPGETRVAFEEHTPGPLHCSQQL